MRVFVRIAVLAVSAFIARPACAQIFIANLTGAQESPPNASPGTGLAEVTINTLAQTMRVQVTFSGLLAGTTASHIHSATAVPGSGNAMVATQVPTFTGFPLGVTSGAYDSTFDLTQVSTYNPAFITANGGTAGSAEAALIAGITAGEAYINIHTTEFPGGEIRGFLTAQAVPEPGALGLLAAMTLGAGLAGFRRRRT